MYTVRETDLRFELRPSTIPNAGIGCFAKVDLKSGDWIEVVGVYVERNSSADFCTSYANRYKFAGSESQNLFIVPMGYAGMINHTGDKQKQNVQLEFCRGLQKRSQDAGQVIYRFLKDIPAGEELLGHYGEDKDKEIQWLAEKADYFDNEGKLWREFLSMNLYNLGLLSDV